MRKKILHRFYDLSCGGVEVVVLNMVRALPDALHILVYNNYYETWLSAVLKKADNVVLNHVEGKDIRTVLDREDPDVLLFHFYPPMSQEDFSLLPRDARSRTILYNHSFAQVPYIPGLRGYCFLSRDSQTTAGARIPPEQCAIVMNPVAPEFFEVRRREGSPFAVGRHSRDAALKFSRDFITLHERFEIPDLQVCVLGCPEVLVKAIASRSHRLRQNYWMLPLNSMAVRRFLSFLDIYVYKTQDSFRETCPLNILEALAAGIPVVAENKGGVRELVVHGETGFLCDSLADYKKGVERLWSDEALREEFSARARDWAARRAALEQFRRNLAALID